MQTATKAAALIRAHEQTIETLAKIWVESCDLRVPHDSWLMGLVLANGLDAAEYAITRTGRKLRAARQTGEPMDAAGARQYCAAVAKNSTSGEFPDRQAPTRQK